MRARTAAGRVGGMSLLWALLSAAFNVASMLWISLLRQLVPPLPRDDRTTAEDPLDVPPDRHLNGRAARVIVRDAPSPQIVEPREELVADSSFLSQLEQRTQQVKITLANLEAEKVRIEGLIARLQPIVPHYDALLEAERAISEAQIALEAAPLPSPENPWDAPQQQEQQQQDDAPRW